MEKNPFASVGSIVQGSSFVGRTNEMRDLEERLMGSEFGNLAIVGIPKVGKSSLMQEALYGRSEQLWENRRFVVVWYTLKTSVDSIKLKNGIYFCVSYLMFTISLNKKKN